MRQKMMNQVIIAGKLYQHDLQLKVVQNEASANKGMEFISGTIDIATDDECTNIVSVHYTYIPRLTKKGTVDSRFTALQNIMNSAKCVVTDGADAAMKLKVQSNLGLNDFYNNNDELVSAKRNESGFITVLSTLDGEERNKFTMDMVIAQVTRVDANEERNIPEHVKLRGYVFDFRNAVLPVEFMVKNEEGMKYFEDLDVTASEPVFTKVWGHQNNQTIKVVQTAEAAFGEAEVNSYDRRIREWVVTGTQKMAYEFDDESADLTPEELKAKIADREVYLAEVKKRADEWKAQRDGGFANAAPAAQTTVAAGGFKF